MWKSITAMLARHLTTFIAAISLVYGGLVYVVQPRAEQFVKQSVKIEQFATVRELQQQTDALRDLAARVAKQSEALEGQSRLQTSMHTDIEAIKDLQRETLRVLLRAERDNQ